MRVAVFGGKLQGVEACYLARRAGWEVILIDRHPSAPARGLCEVFLCHDVLREPEELVRVVRDVDLIIPAMEDKGALKCLVGISSQGEIPLVFDLDAYLTTSSKRKSDDLFCRLGLPAPRPWPDCSPPVIVKPVGSSGSENVTKIVDPEGLDAFLQGSASNPEKWVIQEYVGGPSYSLEVIGLAGECVTLQITALEMDDTFDCKRVLAPVGLPADLDQEFRAMACTLAQSLHLTGLMDLEVVHHEGRLKILEIDARLPSQTPAVVERSTGVNMLELLGDVFLHCRLPEVSMPPAPRGVVYEHIRVCNDRLEVSGEHIMAQAGLLHLVDGFFGADVALTDFTSRGRPWVATLIVSEASRERAWEKRCEVVDAIMVACDVSGYHDPASP